MPRLPEIERDSNRAKIIMQTRGVHVVLFFSYDTLVAFTNILAGTRYRRDRTSRTTARHLSEWGMKEATRLSDSDFENLVRNTLDK